MSCTAIFIVNLVFFLALGNKMFADCLETPFFIKNLNGSQMKGNNLSILKVQLNQAKFAGCLENKTTFRYILKWGSN